MKHTFDVTIENQPAALPHIAGMLAARGFEIDSLSLDRTADPGLSHLRVTVVGDGVIRERVRSQLEKIVTVVRVQVRSRDDARG